MDFFNKRSITSLISLTVSFTVIVGMFSFPAKAQEDSLQSDGWSFSVAPYALFPYMNGFTTIRGKKSAVAVSPGDIFSNLNLGAMLYAEASNPDWAIIMDLLFMDLGQTGETPLGREINTDISQLAFEITGMRRISPVFELGIGFRINSLKGDLFIPEGQFLPRIDVSNTKTWVDPFIAARLMAPLEHPWRLGVRGDIGGFGISSTFTWQLYPFFGHRFSKLFEMILAYRWLGVDYSSGSGNELFEYDMTTFGPELGFLFHF